MTEHDWEIVRRDLVPGVHHWKCSRCDMTTESSTEPEKMHDGVLGPALRIRESDGHPWADGKEIDCDVEVVHQVMES